MGNNLLFLTIFAIGSYTLGVIIIEWFWPPREKIQ